MKGLLLCQQFFLGLPEALFYSSFILPLTFDLCDDPFHVSTWPGYRKYPVIQSGTNPGAAGEMLVAVLSTPSSLEIKMTQDNLGGSDPIS